MAEIDDPLYGVNDPAGAEAAAAVSAAAAVIDSCCEARRKCPLVAACFPDARGAQGLAEELLQLSRAPAGGEAPPLRAALAGRLAAMAPMDWLAPPMLSKKK